MERAWVWELSSLTVIGDWSFSRLPRGQAPRDAIYRGERRTQGGPQQALSVDRTAVSREDGLPLQVRVPSARAWALSSRLQLCACGKSWASESSPSSGWRTRMSLGCWRRGTGCPSLTSARPFSTPSWPAAGTTTPVNDPASPSSCAASGEQGDGCQGEDCKPRAPWEQVSSLAAHRGL